MSSWCTLLCACVRIMCLVFSVKGLICLIFLIVGFFRCEVVWTLLIFLWVHQFYVCVILSGCNLQGHCLAWFTDQILFHSLQQLSSRLSGQRPAGAWHKSASPMSWQRRLVLSCPFSVSFVGTDDTFTRYAYSCCVVFRLWIRPRLLVSLFYFLCYFLPVSFMNEWNRLKALIKSSLFPTAWCC